MIPDHDVATAAHALRGFTPDLLEVFKKHEIIALVVVEFNEDAAAMLEDPKCVAIEQTGKTVLIAEFESREEVSDE